MFSMYKVVEIREQVSIGNGSRFSCGLVPDLDHMELLVNNLNKGGLCVYFPDELLLSDYSYVPYGQGKNSGAYMDEVLFGLCKFRHFNLSIDEVAHLDHYSYSPYSLDEILEGGYYEEVAEE